MPHQKGSKVDVDALRDRIPLWQDGGKGPKMASHGKRGLRRRKSILVDAYDGLGIFGNL